jgi:hypothetical protein
MNAQRDPDRLIHAFLDEGRTELSDQVYDAVRADIENQRQRAVVGPWRMPDMNKLISIGLGAAVVVVVLAVGAQLLGPPAPSGVGGAPATEPSPSPSPAVTSRPTPSLPSAPPLTQSFTSTRHGISVSYPEAWIAQAATQPWTDGTFPLAFGEPLADFLYDPALTSNLFLTIASQLIGDSTPEDWVARQMASDEGCGTATEPIAVDGAAGLIGTDGCTVAAVTTAGRGYWIQLYTSGDEPSAGAYDRAWFQEVLATVQLQPQDAVDAAPSASP